MVVYTTTLLLAHTYNFKWQRDSK